jgi:hypothetical protein
MTTLPLSDAYRSAIRTSIILQLPLVLLMLILLDGGFLAKIGGYSMAGFWIGVGLVMLRRPRNPTRMDLLYVRWGYPVTLAVGIAVAIVVVSVRHTVWGG